MRFLRCFGFWVLASAVFAAFIQQDFDGATMLQISLGTPAQGPFRFWWNSILTIQPSGQPSGLSIGNKRDGGLFDPNISTTFKKSRDGWTVVGTDTIKVSWPEFSSKSQFPGDFSLTDVALTVAHDDKTYGIVPLMKGTPREPTFLDQLLNALGGTKTLVFGIKHTSTQRSPHGTIVLGNAQPDICQTTWTHYLTHERTPFQMAFYTTEITIGDYSYEENIPVAFTTSQVYFNYRPYAAAVQKLRVKPDNTIDCDTKATITIGVGKDEFVLQPEDYIADYGWYCLFTIGRRENMIELPLSVLKGRCLAYDLEERRISFGTLL